MLSRAVCWRMSALRNTAPEHACFLLPGQAATDDDSPGRPGRGEGRHAGGEIIEPGDEARMAVAPVAAETEIAIAKRAGERNLPDIGRRLERRRRRFERGKAARHLAGLMFKPSRLVHVGLAPARLVNGQDRRIENAVAERLQAQG